MRFFLLGASNAINPNAIPSHIIKQWQDLGLITYLGENSDVRPFIAQSSCVVLPSYYKEGVPRSLLEALAMGKPIITTINSGCTELITLKNSLDSRYIRALATQSNPKISYIQGENGFLCLPKNALSLYGAIKAFDTQAHKNYMRAALTKATSYNIAHILSIYTNKAQAILGCLRDTRDSSKLDSSKPTSPHHTKSHAPKPRICFVSNTCFGMYNFRLQVLLALKQDYEIHIIAPFDTTTPKLLENGFFVYDINMDSKSTNIYSDIRFVIALRKYFRLIKPKLVFNYTIKPAIYSSILLNLYKIPNIAIITGLGYVFIDGGFKKKVLKQIVTLLYKIALKRTKEVWFLNNDDKQEFLDLHLITTHQAFVLQSEGVDLEYFKPDFIPNPNFTPQNKAQEEYLNTPINDGETRFLLIARMLWDKGIGEFVEAARMIQEEASNGGGVI